MAELKTDWADTPPGELPALTNREKLEILRERARAQRELCDERHANTREHQANLSKRVDEILGIVNEVKDDTKHLRKTLLNGGGLVTELRKDVEELEQWRQNHELLSLVPRRSRRRGGKAGNGDDDDSGENPTPRPRGFWSFLRSLPPAGWLIVGLLVLVLAIFTVTVITLVVVLSDADQLAKVGHFLSILPGLGGK